MGKIKNKVLLKELLSFVLWDSNLNTEEAANLFDKDDLTSEELMLKKSLMIKLLNGSPWYKIIRAFEYDFVKSAFLTEDVINGLFPKEMKARYNFVKQVLQ